MQSHRKETSPLTEQDIKVEFETWQPTVCDNLRTELQKTQSTNIGSNALKEVPRIQSTNINRNTRQKELWDKAMSVDVEELLDCSFCGEVFHNKFGLIDHEAICQPLLSNRAPQNDSDQRHRKTTRSSRSKEQQIDEIIAHETELMAICSDELKKEPQDHQPLLPIKQENKTEEMQLQESIDIDVDMMKKELGEDVILLDAEEAFNCSYCGSIFYSESSLITHETDMHPPLETNDQYQSSTSSVDVQEINNFAENSDDSVEIVHVHKSLPANSSVQLVANRSNIHHQININSSHSKKLIEEAIDKYTNDKLKSLQTAQQAEGNSNQGEVNSSTSAELVKPLLTFTCIICSEKFSSKSLILNHVKEKHYENIFKCDQCNFETLHESQMQEHSKIHPKILEEQDEIQEILITNPKIDAKSGGDKTKENLETGSKVDGNSGENETPVNSKTDTNIDGKLRENEIEENSKSQSKIYLKPECDICKRTYSHMSTFKKHYRTFHQNPVPKYVCDFESCRYVTHVQGRLAEHKTRQHSKVKEDLLHCKIAGCVATFRYQSHLKIHILHRHSDTLECYFECDTCHKRFDEKFKLIKHLETHNKKNVKVYKCKACSITFNSNYYYEKHFFSVHKKAKFSCKYCGDKFMNRNKLWSHENNKHLKPAINETFECFKCNKKFKSRKTLEKHLKPRSNEVFECPECQKKFRSKMSMERHRKNHSESHFDCADCGYQTKHKELLKRHIVRKHTKKYNFKCTEPGCDKKFKLNIDYQWHVKKCHDKSVTG